MSNSARSGSEAGTRHHGGDHPLCQHPHADGRDAVTRRDRYFGAAVLVFKVEFPRDKVGTFDTELVREWFNAFAINAG